MLKNNISVPSKVFLLGEYAVLSGSPGILSAFAPRFALSPGKGGEAANFHPDSPAGQLQKSDPSYEWEGIWEYYDPHRGLGGFGGSTAEFLVSFAVAKLKQGSKIEPEDMWDAWTRYREINGLASGTDLITQWMGGTAIVDIENKRAQRLHLGDMGRAILIFSASHQPNRKVKTHEHLDHLKPTKGIFNVLHEVVQSGYDAILRQNLLDLGAAMNRYGDFLRAMGLERAETTADRVNLAQIPGVLAVKGTGALQADGILVVIHPSSMNRKEEIITAVESHNLRLICRGLSVQEPGLSLE